MKTSTSSALRSRKVAVGIVTAAALLLVPAAAFSEARSAGFVGTDEASLVERIGGRVTLVPDVSTNLKVTTPADLRIAEAIATAAT